MVRGRWLALALAGLPALGHGGEYDFDIEAFEREPPFTLRGYGELRYEHLDLAPDAALYAANYGETSRERLDRLSETVELEATYRLGETRFNALLHATARQDALQEEEDGRFYEAYAARQALPRLSLEAGKRALRWGKGYAWNPVGFIERPKDPLDPELAREGFVLAAADLVGSGAGDLRTIALTPVFLPVRAGINEEFGEESADNIAGKLYLLYRDIDIDLLYRSAGSRSYAFGIDFATNLRPNFEIHGEWAHYNDELRRFPGGSEVRALQSWLLGLRYLSAAETTYILEYYHDERGLSEAELETFFSTPVPGAELPGGDAARPTLGQDYGYLRVTQKDLGGVVYLSGGLTLIANLADTSLSITPELTYTGISDLELRARLTRLVGDAGSEFGEKANAGRFEVRARYFF